MFFKPALSVIAVFHNMAREAPRTLFTLSAQYQRGVYPDDYEVIVVDAGSSAPLEQSFVKSFGENFKLVRSPAPPSSVAVKKSVIEDIGSLQDLQSAAIKPAYFPSHPFRVVEREPRMQRKRKRFTI